MAFAALIAPLVISGSRKSDGTANATGEVRFYRPGTTTPVIVYSDANASATVSAPLILDNGGRVNYDDYPEGIYATQPIRLVIQDTDGNVVTDTTFIPATAGDVGVDNDYFPSSTTLNEVLTEAGTSFGGTGFKYKEAGGATERDVADVIREQGVSVTDYGAVGDGIADDTSALQTAFNRAIALSANLLLPAGTYKISQSIIGTSASGVRIIGAGMGSTTVQQTNGSGTVWTFGTASTDCSVERMTLEHAATSSNAGIAFVNAVRPSVANVRVTDGDFTKGVSIDGDGVTNTSATVTGGFIGGITTGLELADCVRAVISDAQLNSGAGGLDQSVLMSGTTAQVYITNCIFFGSTGVNFGNGTGTDYVISGCPTLGTNTTLAMDMSTRAADPVLSQWGNRVDQKTYSAAVGNTLSILIQAGYSPILIAASGGAGTMTVAAPFPTPTTSGTGPEVYLDIQFKNASSGAVTWSLNAAFVVNAAIPTTDGHTINVRFRWDRTTSKWRECGRGDTVT